MRGAREIALYKERVFNVILLLYIFQYHTPSKTIIFYISVSNYLDFLSI
jgi:hypothetical protein